MKLNLSDNGRFGRGRSWLVTCYMDGKRIRRTFETRAEAEQYAIKTRAALDAGSDPEATRNASRLCFGTGYSIDELVKIALAHMQHTPIANNSSATFADGVRLYLAKQAQTGVRQITLMQTTAALRSLMKVFGHRPVVSITESEVEDFLALLKNRQGQPGGASTYTKLRMLEYLKSVYRTLGFVHPLSSVRKPRPTNDERSGRFFSVDQFVAIMSVARPSERGMLAMALIGGMRPWVLERLSVRFVDMDHRRIHIPSSSSMDRRPRSLETEQIHPENGSIIPGLPAVLWEWLKHFPFEPRPWGPMQKRIAGKIGFWIQDGCRNTAATYYNRLHGMAATAALISSERGYHDVTRHYVASVSQADADRFYSINPTDFLGKRPPREDE